MELSQVNSEVDYQVLSDLYKQIKNQQKVKKSCDKSAEGARLSSEIHELIDECLQQIEKALETNGESEHQRLLAMKLTLLYERSKELVNEGEETSAEEILATSLSITDRFSSTAEMIFLVLRIVNHYAYLLVKRHDYETARKILEQSESIYREVKEKTSVVEFFTSKDLFSKDVTVVPSNTGKLERLVTGNLQMLCLVYTRLELHDESAKYQHEILQRQLETHDDDRSAWSIKSAKLACFFIERNRFKEARNHLAAASHALLEYEKMKLLESSENIEEKSPDLLQKYADVAKCWVKYGLTLFARSKMNVVADLCQDSNELLSKLWASPLTLSTASEESTKVSEKLEKSHSRKHPGTANQSSRSPLPRILEDHEFHPVTDLDEKSTPEVNNNKNFFIHEGPLLLFEKLDLREGEEQVTASAVETTEEARMLFHHTHTWLKRVKLFYSLQDHPMEYIEAIMDLSELYRYLAFYEEDIESQYVVHKLRADALETLSTVLREVRPQCYIAASVEILRELAEVQMELMGLNLRRIYAAQMSPETTETVTKKVEALCDLHNKLKVFGNSLSESEDCLKNEKSQL